MIRFAPIPDHPVALQSNSPMQSASGNGMGKYGAIGGKFSGIDGKEAGERLVAFLRERYPRKTAAMVAADTGIPAESVAKWLSGCSLPNFAATCALLKAYDIDFWASVLPDPPDCIVAEQAARRMAVLRASIEAQQRELESLRR